MKRKMTALLLTGALGASAIAGGVTSSFAASLKIADTQENQEEQDTSSAEADSESSGIFSSGRVAMTSMTSGFDDMTPAEFSYGSVSDVAQACLPSIVSITNKSVQEVRNYFFSNQPQSYEAVSAGTGIIVGENDTELLICTNNHVVDNSTELTVTFSDDESIPAQVKGTDPSVDLAIVAVELDDIPEETIATIKIAQTGNSDDMKIGEQVVAIGNALGYGQSVTTGIISAFDRSIQVSENGYTVAATYDDLIQTDAAINAGNSGGALLNMKGEVIGINSAKASRSGVEGMGYAIPISKAKPILEKLMTRKTRSMLEKEEMGYIGINGQNVSAEATSLYGIPAGAYITFVGDDTPASEAGLEKGNIITAFDGETITGMEDLQRLLQYYKAGEEVEMTISSNADGAYVEKTVTITLGDRSEMEE